MKSHSHPAAVTGRRPRTRRGFGALAWPCLLLGGACALPAAASDVQSAAVTIEGSRAARHELEQQVDQYVDSAMVHPFGEALMRWDTPVCPLVGGLPRERGEFILARLSQTAREAGIPLAPEKCAANFIVIVTANPNPIIEQLRDKRPGLFSNGRRGIGGFDHFLLSQQPIRVWYNWQNEGEPTASLAVVSALIGDTAVGGTLGGSPSASLAELPVNRLPNSRLSYAVHRSIHTAIVMVDLARVKRINMGQLADYSAMVGFAQINQDHPVEAAPSVLRLFNEPSQAPAEGMSPWDRALLKSLYATRSLSVTQVSEMETQIVNTLSAPR
ncbi:MAG: hypothetical protein JSR36_07940 [Proteobacteria bacterium]|nr:hypothetical protein [Pseudomonadota bacterium]